MSQSTSKRRNRSRHPPQPMPPLSIVARISTSSEPPVVQRQQQPLLHRNNNNSNSNIVVAPSLLVALSESCRKHGASAHASNHQNRDGCAAMLDDVPPGCREALTSLRTVLPKVEQAYPSHHHHHASTTTTTTVQDLAHMCDFYNDVLSGGFCPHAPHLFLGACESECFEFGTA